MKNNITNKKKIKNKIIKGKKIVIVYKEIENKRLKIKKLKIEKN